jgi:hypothetical protein
MLGIKRMTKIITSGDIHLSVPLRKYRLLFLAIDFQHHQSP